MRSKHAILNRKWHLNMFYSFCASVDMLFCGRDFKGRVTNCPDRTICLLHIPVQLVIMVVVCDTAIGYGIGFDSRMFALHHFFVWICIQCLICSSLQITNISHSEIFGTMLCYITSYKESLIFGVSCSTPTNMFLFEYKRGKVLLKTHFMLTSDEHLFDSVFPSV